MSDKTSSMFLFGKAYVGYIDGNKIIHGARISITNLDVFDALDTLADSITEEKVYGETWYTFEFKSKTCLRLAFDILENNNMTLKNWRPFLTTLTRENND